MGIGEGIFMISKFRREILSKTKGFVQMGILSKRILPTSSFSYLEVKDVSCGESSGVEEIQLGIPSLSLSPLCSCPLRSFFFQ